MDSKLKGLRLALPVGIWLNPWYYSPHGMVACLNASVNDGT
jgi:hypothetical protein